MHIISGTHKRQHIISPKIEGVRPTSSKLRETLFNICQTFVVDASFLDLFAGSGAMGLEALSRGAKSATFIDYSKECIRCIQQNLRQLQLEEKAQVIYGDVLQQVERLSKLKQQYDIIYADPPYDATIKSEGKILKLSTYLIRIIDKGLLLVPSGDLFVEESFDTFLSTEVLNRLKLISSRRIGQSLLQHYKAE